MLANGGDEADDEALLREGKNVRKLKSFFLRVEVGEVGGDEGTEGGRVGDEDEGGAGEDMGRLRLDIFRIPRIFFSCCRRNGNEISINKMGKTHKEKDRNERIF